MAEPFKNEFNAKVIALMGKHLQRAWSEFDQTGFENMCLDKLESLELKERIKHISGALTAFLPQDNFDQSTSILLDSLAPYHEGGAADWQQGITGWGTLPLNDYVATHGSDHFDKTMLFFKQSTAHFSAEFDIRYFLLGDQDRTLDLLWTWTKDSNYHVRRLVSEGTRPRLPWAMKLQPFIDDPSPILPLLEALRDDEEEYIRRSVANNLNDIAKDHPDLVAKIAKAWLKDADKNRQRLVKHACRTLIKQGHKQTLEALGFGDPNVVLEAFNIKTPIVAFGNALEFEIVLRSTLDQTQELIIDYAIYHRKANGSTSPKVFKWKNITLKANNVLNATKKHMIKPITTRVYYNGTHAVEIFINGISLGKQDFQLHGV